VLPIGTEFFADISDASGIRKDNFVSNPARPIPINDHSRLAFADLNGDYLDDIVMHSLFPNPRDAGIPFEHLVFLNNGDGTFADFSADSGLKTVQAAFFAFGDVDNDGDQDAFAGLDIPLSGYTHQLLLNDGAGHFTPKARSGLEGTAGDTYAGNAVFADFNGDAKLDLFVGNGHTLAAVSDRLYFGNGDGTFDDVTGPQLRQARQRPSNGSVACDYDNDRDLDVFVSVYGVSHELGANVLWENDGRGSFSDVAVQRGFASLATGNYFLRETGRGRNPEPGKAPGQYVGSNGFGLQCEDVNNDGLLDVFLSTISHPVPSDYNRMWSDPSQLLINTGPEGGYAFVNQFLDRGLPFNEGDVDAGMADFDNDGLIDLSVSREDKYEDSYIDEEQRGWFGLMHQLPDGRFESVGLSSGINDPQERLGRMKRAQNHVWSDIDQDGDLDLLVGARDQGGGRPNFLFENLIGSQNAWLSVHLRGDGRNVNRDAIGARVELVSVDRALMREVKSSRGMYNSMDSRALHFGLGDLGCDFEMRVTWPDGTSHAYPAEQVGVNGTILLTYGQEPALVPTVTPQPPIPTPMPPAGYLPWAGREQR
jgi:hypothetical protein